MRAFPKTAARDDRHVISLISVASPASLDQVRTRFERYNETIRALNGTVQRQSNTYDEIHGCHRLSSIMSEASRGDPP